MQTFQVRMKLLLAIVDGSIRSLLKTGMSIKELKEKVVPKKESVQPVKEQCTDNENTQKAQSLQYS